MRSYCLTRSPGFFSQRVMVPEVISWDSLGMGTMYTPSGAAADAPDPKALWWEVSREVRPVLLLSSWRSRLWQAFIVG